MIQIVYLNDENSLTHHGIKGMKWGVRRFQNYDGTRIGDNKKRIFNPGPIDQITSRQSNFAKSIANSKDDTEIRNKTKNALSKEDINELKNLSNDVIKISKNIDWPTQYAKEDAYEREYDNRAIDWSIKKQKEYSMDGWRQIEKEAKEGGFNVRDHKAVRYGMDGYDEIEPYNPPRSKEVKAYHDAVDKYCEKARSCTDKLLGQYGHEVVNKDLQKFNGAAGDWVDTKVWYAINDIVNEDRR